MPSVPHEKENIVSASGLNWNHQQDVKDTTIQEASWSTTQVQWWQFHTATAS
jgi:hypothetical protein